MKKRSVRDLEHEVAVGAKPQRLSPEAAKRECKGCHHRRDAHNLSMRCAVDGCVCVEFEGKR